MKKIKKYVVCAIAAVLLAGIFLLYRYNYFPHRKYPGTCFGIEAYISPSDRDSDGIDDQTDILSGAKAYLETEPDYKSRYYAAGYPDDGYGVCTDVVAFALLAGGYDLKTLVAADIEANPQNYEIDAPDSNIDFRRVRNIKVYLEKNAISLTTDLDEPEEWQAGDIVVWRDHAGIISDSRNYKGVPFVLRNASRFQAAYEEDILGVWGKIVGHYRMS